LETISCVLVGRDPELQTCSNLGFPTGQEAMHPLSKQTMMTSKPSKQFRVLGLEYLERRDLAQAPPELNEPTQTEISTNVAIPESVTSSHKEKALSPSQSIFARDFTESGNGTGNLKARTEINQHATALIESSAAVDTLSAHLSEMMGDAPFCEVCGHISIRNGSCYACLNYGNSRGCS
jgi:ribonucleoside-diphosphate reductase alpha chain